jgi:hypothetical protein
MQRLPLFTAAAAVLMTAPSAFAGGIGYPLTGADAYCNARRMGMSQDSALEVAVEKAWSDNVDSESSTGIYNRGVMARKIYSECNNLWVD